MLSKEHMASSLPRNQRKFFLFCFLSHGPEEMCMIPNTSCSWPPGESGSCKYVPMFEKSGRESLLLDVLRI
uniref:Uncharacterized protein n=1 Tax=Anguilla anguilla TaxID=7936 RepID=A0A0E9UMS3_ANGAN